MSESPLELTSDRLDALRKYAEDLESDGARSGTIRTDSLRALLDHVAKLDGSITRYALKISKSQTREATARAEAAEAAIERVKAAALATMHNSMEPSMIIRDAGFMQDAVQSVCLALGLDVDELGWDAVIEALKGDAA